MLDCWGGAGRAGGRWIGRRRARAGSTATPPVKSWQDHLCVSPFPLAPVDFLFYIVTLVHGKGVVVDMPVDVMVGVGRPLSLLEQRKQWLKNFVASCNADSRPDQCFRLRRPVWEHWSRMTGARVEFDTRSNRLEISWGKDG